MMNASASVAFCQVSTTDLSSVVGMKSYPVPCTTVPLLIQLKGEDENVFTIPQARMAGTAWGSGCQAGLAVSPQDPHPQSKSNHLKNKVPVLAHRVPNDQLGAQKQYVPVAPKKRKDRESLAAELVKHFI